MTNNKNILKKVLFKKVVIFITAFSFILGNLANPAYALRQRSFVESPRAKTKIINTPDGGVIEIQEGAIVEEGVKFIAKKGERITIGKGTKVFALPNTIIRG